MAGRPRVEPAMRRVSMACYTAPRWLLDAINAYAVENRITKHQAVEKALKAFFSFRNGAGRLVA